MVLVATCGKKRKFVKENMIFSEENSREGRKI
jgi:hypothetical protein